MNQLTEEVFRQQLAGLHQVVFQEGEQREIAKSSAIRWTCLLAEVFGSDLDRKTLWERISNALKSASAKADGDVLRFAHESLDFVKADPRSVAKSERIRDLMGQFGQWDAPATNAFLHYIRNYNYVLIAEGYVAWEQRKDEMKAAKK